MNALFYRPASKVMNSCKHRKILVVRVFLGGVFYVPHCDVTSCDVDAPPS